MFSSNRMRSMPQLLGHYGDWTAATNTEAGALVCYAFTRAQNSAPHIAGRGDVVLTVTERTITRDAVGIGFGMLFSPDATLEVIAGSSTFEFYSASRSAFARDGHAVLLAFERSDKVVAKSQGPGPSITDEFSLLGFAAAYSAVVRTCPNTR